MTQKQNHTNCRIIAIFFLTIFFPTILPVNLYASNNGPNAIDAANFEPVDAKDMVNLFTGDMSYVLPLLNVPSPEGGYPLALSYHAGIAMDQESSWVGLGWSLNPGAINRNTNGYADDVELGNERVFSFHQAEVNFYNIGIGSNIMGVNAGVGAYWGSNKTLGGSVSLGYGPISVSASSVSGMGISAGYTGEVGSLATSFNTKSNKGVSNSGVGMSSQSSGFSGSDGGYNISTSYDGFNISAYYFNFNYGHTKTRYNYFKEEFMNYSGILYPLGPISTQDIYGSSSFGRNADVNKLLLYRTNYNIFDVLDTQKHYQYDNALLPNFDKYIVNAQGLNGTMTPTFLEEVPLYHTSVKAKDEVNDLNYYGLNNNNSYVHPGTYYKMPTPFNNLNHDLRLNNKFFFEFENTNSSALRVDKGPLTRNTETPNPDLRPEMIAAKHAGTTASVYGYDENYWNGIPMKNGNRKRTGKHIASFTNQQILSGGINFIEAKGLNRSQSEVYLPQSIGGFRITDVDGKVYHYSLPVINYEIWYKNFTDQNDEHNGFVEKETSTPYATDWLLTAVTGADYVDINSNGVVDEGDYGYWVEFEYGKWSDGYMWKSASGNSDVVNDGYDNKDSYEYYMGRKQIYYLDAVKTRTHTAYFIKSLRYDASGQNTQIYANQSTVSNFNVDDKPKIYTAADDHYGYHYPGGLLDLSLYNIPSVPCDGVLDNYRARKKVYKYFDFPKHYSLKLDKILLVKNNTLVLNKGAGAPLRPDNKAYFYENSAIDIFEAYFRNNGSNVQDDCLNGVHYRDTNHALKEINIHNSNNVLDVNDVSGVNINTSAEKVISFDQTYSLMPGSPNCITASNPTNSKLALQNINFLGKKGVAYLPPYRFNYNTNSSFDVNNEDGWGYNSPDPAAWSLSSIVTPTSSMIKFNYEQDDYNAVASKASRLFNKGLTFYGTQNSATNELTFIVAKNTDANDNIYQDFSQVTGCFTVGDKISLDMFACRKYRGFGGVNKKEVSLNIDSVEGTVTGVNAQNIIFTVPNSMNYWFMDNQNEGWLMGRKMSLTSFKHSDDNPDSVIMRETKLGECPSWRGGIDGYDNDDVSFQYTLFSSNVVGKNKGGGVRVKSVDIWDAIANTAVNSYKYYYNQPGSSKIPSDPNYISSGITSFAPSKEPQIIPYASEIPPAFVMYKNVSVEEYGRSPEMLTKTDYIFETLAPYSTNMQNSYYRLGEHLDINGNSSSDMNGRLRFTQVKIKSKLNYLGRLLSIKNYNKYNHLLSSVSNEYFEPSDSPGELGVKQESYISKGWKFDTMSDLSTFNYITSSSKIWYPNRLVRSKALNKGFTSTTYYNEFDFLTGDLLEQRISLSDGKMAEIISVPAYNKYSGMGALTDNPLNKNMLTQNAVTSSYLLDNINGGWKQTGVGITTWSNEWSYMNEAGTVTTPVAAKEKIWRKHANYIWKGVVDNNGYFQNYASNEDGFNWAIGAGSQPAHWRKTSEISLYDRFSNALEIKDINGNLVTQKLDIKNTKTICESNAGYNEAFYSGAENLSGSYLEPGIRLVSGSRTTTRSHTGQYSIAATQNTQFGVLMNPNQHRAGRYKLSVWVHVSNSDKARVRAGNATFATTYDFNGEKYRAGDWILKTHYFDSVTTGDFSASVCSSDNTAVYFDDFRIHPINAGMTSYVHNQNDEITHIIGSNNLAVRYDYDAGGRIIRTYVETVDDSRLNTKGGFKLKSKAEYNNHQL